MSKVLVNFIQDRSGSMQSVWDETLNGFKVFVNELREKGEKDGVEYLLSLTVFDTQIDTPLIAQPIWDVDTDILQKHGPRGSTALYDAVGQTIKNTDDNRHGAEKIIVVIATDGQENSSREWDKDKLHAAIDKHLNAGDWTFTYLGTQPETWDDASSIGVPIGSTALYTGTSTSAGYAATSASLHAMACSSQKQSFVTMDSIPDHVAVAARMTKSKDAPKPSAARRPTSPPMVPPKPKAKTNRKWK